jgi:hypothetical protein
MNTKAAIIPRAAIPPITPPTIAPIGVDLPVEGAITEVVEAN